MNEIKATVLPDIESLAEIKKLMGTVNLPADVLMEIANAIKAKKQEKAARIRKIRRPRERQFIAENGDWVLPYVWHCAIGIKDQLWAQANMEEFADGN